MKFLFDMFPVILFFVAFKMWGIYEATAIAIAATVVQIGWVWFKHKKVEPMQWVTLSVIVVFGGASLILHNETFIKWKPTVLYWLFAGALGVGARAFGKNFIRSMMEKQMSLPDAVWSKLLWAWVFFFTLMGVLNLAIAYNFSTDTWVNFKLFGGMGLMLLFVIGQALMLSKHMQSAPETPQDKQA